MLWYIVQRAEWVNGIRDVVVATTDQPQDEPVRRFCQESGITAFAGHDADVLDRVYQAAVWHHADPIVRITGDCPFVDPELVQRVLELYSAGAYDYVGVATGAGAVFLEGNKFPDGLDAECFSFAALERAWREAADPLDREHVTSYIWRNRQLFLCGTLTSDRDYSRLRWTVDHEVDFRLVSRVYEALYTADRPFLMSDILQYLTGHPELAALNQAFVGEEDYLQFWKLAAQERS